MCVVLCGVHRAWYMDKEKLGFFVRKVKIQNGYYFLRVEKLKF